MTGYAKLFSRILDSTIWREDDKTRILWITMLALADRDGVVHCTIPGLADRARITLAECEDALERFQQPDKYSWSKEAEGRRITVVEGGWFLINHAKYRAMMSADEQREKTRLRVQRFRQKNKSLQTVTDVTGNQSNDIADTKAKAEEQAPPSFSDLKPSEAAKMFLEHEDVCIPVTVFELRDTQSVIETIQRSEKIDTFAALKLLISRAQEVLKSTGKRVGPGWARKVGYAGTGKKKQPPMVNPLDILKKQAEADGMVWVEGVGARWPNELK